MRREIRNRLMLFLSLIFSLCLILSLILLQKSICYANCNTDIISVVPGASVRVNSLDSSGIKFRARVKKDKYLDLYNEYSGKVKAGMIIVPSDYIVDNKYTLSDFSNLERIVARKNIEQFKQVSDEGIEYLEFTISLVDIKSTNYVRNFEPIPYIEIEHGSQISGCDFYDGKNYLYAIRNPDNARNIYEVSKKVYNDRTDSMDENHAELIDGKYSSMDTKGLEIVKAYLDGVSEIVINESTAKLYSSEYYSSPNTLVSDKNGVYLFGSSKSVLYNGKDITSQLPFTDEQSSLTIGKASDIDLFYSQNVDVKNLEATGFNGKETADKNSGSITFSAINNGEEFSTSNTATFVINEDISEKFIKVGFDSVKTSAFPSESLAIAINVRQQITSQSLKDSKGQLSIVPWSNSNYAYLSLNGKNVKYWSGMSSLTKGSASWRDVKEGTKYYIVTGIKGQGDDATYYWLWLDENNNLLRAFSATAEQLKEIYPEFSLSDSGYVTIHSMTDNERTITYQTITYGEALYYYNGAKDVEDLKANGEVISWTGIDGAQSYSIKVNDGEWIDIGNSTSYTVSNLISFSDNLVMVRANFEGFSSKGSSINIKHTPLDILLVNTKDEVAIGSVSALKGQLTFTNTLTNSAYNGSTSAMILKRQFTNQFIKIGFTALDDNSSKKNLTNAIGFSIGFRRSSDEANTINDLCITPYNNAHYVLMYNDGKYKPFSYSNIIDVTVNGDYDLITKGEEYYWVFGISSDGYFHLMLLDKDGKTIRHSKAGLNFYTSKFGDTLPTSGYFTINNFALGTRTLSWEILEESEFNNMI